MNKLGISLLVITQKTFIDNVELSLDFHTITLTNGTDICRDEFGRREY